ncbi:MAG: hypothetical protein DWQ34_12670 [Planctomycetota bacterium]|nr:MAG: hypothetical protein DWQ29_15995 [Planctomycetota bacterium]REJ92589.1 MAG: hypothetical protein DWQ34_12670 [Planctomycetota bacterium]REK25553.1 MAG: hypothetical protein DWQ41_11465 [Planctomycetota bacterium]REK31735.1 MAG: hypothetical protein DWQ45_19220 [Planctomycetota bacterium]
MRFGTLLWHGEEPIGICLFVSPPMSLAPRNRYFGRSGRWSRDVIRAMNAQLVMLSRVVLHPSYRGAGLAAAFVRRSCELCPYRWIEALAEMGRVNPFFEKAGFVRAGSTSPKSRTRRALSTIYGGRRKRAGRRLITPETFHKSRYGHPVYYVFDNRSRGVAADGRQRENDETKSREFSAADGDPSRGGSDQNRRD